jgi:prolyl-tRNA synthetase
MVRRHALLVNNIDEVKKKGGSKMANGILKITPRDKDYSRWYQDVIAAAELAETSSTRGCMIILPNGTSLWENIQKILGREIKREGIRNWLYPSLLKLSLLKKEEEHAEGFAKECAVVTHHRLILDQDKGLIPDGKLEEPLVIRPTSETIIYDDWKTRFKSLSYKDFPFRMNQWCNVMRWEMRTRLFLRTTEFYWQEGHTAHISEEDAEREVRRALKMYQEFVEGYLAIPVIPGRKSASETFPGAGYTTTIEAMMQDGRALQAGTSHFLGQKFSKTFEVEYTDQGGQQQLVWQTCWGLSTRIIGALIMTHSDDKGLILPPRIAPTKAVIVPIMPGGEVSVATVAKAHELAGKFFAAGYDDVELEVIVDDSEGRPGAKFYKWERQGIPIRIEVGPKDIANRSVVMVRRDTGEKLSVSEDNLVQGIEKILDDIQSNLFRRALAFREANIREADSYEEFKEVLKSKGGFIQAHWCGDEACEASIKEETQATTRCVPFDQEGEDGSCIYCGKESTTRIIFAKAY